MCGPTAAAADERRSDSRAIRKVRGRRSRLSGITLGTHMDEARQQPWARVMVLVGIMYALIGIVFAWPANHVRVWRLAAWLVSAAAYAAHIGYERLGLRNPPRRAAVHVALAVALGAFGLAVAAILHSLSVVSTTQHRRLLFGALVIWPIMTGLPAFLVALGAGKVLSRRPWNARAE
jgi:hypothetical protein